LSENLPGVSTFVGGVGVDTVLSHRKLFWEVDFSGWWLLGILFGFMENLTGGSTVLGGVGGDCFWYEKKAVWDRTLFCFTENFSGILTCLVGATFGFV
jgi:hypothetical protein